MKRLFIFLGLLFFSIWTYGQTNHSGTIDTETWYKADNPHIITGNLTIPIDVTLTIQAGCIIKFKSNKRMVINGVLKANGTQSEMITFTSSLVTPSEGDWRAIEINGGQEGTVLNYCNIEYGGQDYNWSDVDNASIRIIDSSEPPVISHCVINMSASSGINIGSNQNQEQLAYVSDCEITNCADYPIYTFNPNTCSLISGTMNFSGNGFDAIYMGDGHITLSGTWHNTGFPFVIEKFVKIDTLCQIVIAPGCEIKFFNGHSTRLFVYGTIQANGTAANHITFTSIDPSSGHWGCFAIWDIPSGSSLSYCDILYGGSRWSDTNYTHDYAGAVSIANCAKGNLELSHISVQYSDTVGLYIHNESFPTIANCVITDNKIGMLLSHNGIPEFGTSSSEWNDIYNNNGINMYLDNNWISGPPQTDVNAKNVYWGTTNCEEIGNSIFDAADGNTTAYAYYNPWLDASHNVVSTTSDTWTGTTDSDWGTGSNWNGGSVPCYMFDVEIPGSIPNYPNITGSDSCRNLTMKPGAEISIASTAELNVFGDFEMQVNTSGDNPSLVNYGNFSVRNSSTIQDYISAGRWHYLSSPLSEDTAGIFMDMYLYSFDESIYDTNATGQTTAGWVNITDESTSLIPGTGYKVWSYSANPGSKIVNFTGGSPNDGIIELTTIATDQNGNGSIDGKEGWNLVGNPFPSAIDWDNSGWIGKSKFDASIYVYNGSQYLSWNGSVGEGSLTDGVIPAMQAFFVKATDFSPSLKVGNSARVHGVSPYKESEVQNLLKLTVYGNGFKDETFINFNENATQGFDSQFDAYKLKGIVEAPQLYSIAGDDILSINVLPGFENEVTVPLGFEVGVGAEYTITASDLDSFSGGVDVYLEDLQENVIIDLSEQNEYMFLASPLDEPERFVLHFFGQLGTDNIISDDNSVNIYSYGNEVFVKNNSSEDINAEVVVFNISGQIMAQKSILLTNLEKINLNIKPGYYIVQVRTEKVVNTQSVILR